MSMYISSFFNPGYAMDDSLYSGFSLVPTERPLHIKRYG